MQEMEIRQQAPDFIRPEIRSPCFTSPLDDAHIRASSFKCMVKINVEHQSSEGKLIYGTYIHPDLVASVAGWISPAFQLKVNRIINNFMVVEYKTKLSALQHQVAIKEEQISSLQEDLITSTAASISFASFQDAKISSLTEDLHDTSNKHLVAATALMSKKQELNGWAETHAFTLLNLNDAKCLMPYYAI